MTERLAADAVPDIGAFCARLIRMDPAALVRLRPVADDVVALWAPLPFGVLVTRLVRSPLPDDATVSASDLLAGLERGDTDLPARRDVQWRSPLPPDGGEVLDEVPSAEVRRIADAAATTLRAASGRGVGERRLRDELLDHVALIVTRGQSRAEVPVRLVQGLVRMGFPGPDGSAVRIRRAGRWLGAEGTYGSAWYRPAGSLGLSPVPPRR